MQFVLSRAVVVLLFAPLFASQGLSPRSRTVYCVPYSTITPVLRRVLSVSRAIYYKIALLFVSYTASVITGSYATASPDIRQFRVFQLKVIWIHVRSLHQTSPTLIAWHYYATLQERALKTMTLCLP